MDSSVSLKDEIWVLRVCHHISNAVYFREREREREITERTREVLEKAAQ
jgi:hypothetical protein